MFVDLHSIEELDFPTPNSWTIFCNALNSGKTDIAQSIYVRKVLNRNYKKYIQEMTLAEKIEREWAGKYNWYNK